MDFKEIGLAMIPLLLVLLLWNLFGIDKFIPELL